MFFLIIFLAHPLEHKCRTMLLQKRGIVTLVKFNIGPRLKMQNHWKNHHNRKLDIVYIIFDASI